MKREKLSPLPSADMVHEFANMIVGLCLPRAWVRRLSLKRRRILVDWIGNYWARANDNNVRKIPRPTWVPSKYVYRQTDWSKQ